MGEQGAAISPLFEENELEWVLAIDMHSVRDAAGLGPGAMHVFETKPAHLVARILTLRYASRDNDSPVSAVLPFMAPGQPPLRCRSVAAASASARRDRHP